MGRRPGAVRTALAAALLAVLPALLPACGPEEEGGLELAGLSAAALQEDPRTEALPDRFEISLDGSWNFLPDRRDEGLEAGWAEILHETGEAPPGAGKAGTMPVPLGFETRMPDGAYDGVAWYWRTVGTPPALDARGELLFDQVNHACRVWFDGVEVGQHVGGYGPFRIDVSEQLRARRAHTLVVRVVDPGATPVDDLTLKIVPHAKESWYENHGGLLGSVRLRAWRGLRAEVEWLRPEPGPGHVVASLEVHGPDDGELRFAEVEVRVRPLALGARRPGPDDRRPPPLVVSSERVRVEGPLTRVPLRVAVPAPLRWSPERPHRYLYEVRVLEDGEGPSPPDDERTFGFRDVRLDGDGFHLDGRRRVLRGVLYQPHYVGRGGVAPPADELEAEVLAMKAAGLDLVRAHVRPAPPAFLDACDRLGLMVLEEPAIGWVQDSKRLRRWLLEEVEWMVRRDHHHPSLVLWGMLNELSGSAHPYGREMSLHCAALDPTRPVLEDSGGFFGARYVPAGGDALLEMLDEHVYPPCPIPFEERELMQSYAHATGPALVSEYGYGTLIDTQAAMQGFYERKVRGVERNLYVGMAGRTRVALDSGETWSEDAWLAGAADVHAEMGRDMTELLRAGPGLDGLVYTQWRGVSNESSAGLLDPWGDERPAYAALRDALEPFQLSVHPQRPSVAQGESLRVDVAVVNDTGAPVEGEVVLEVSGGVREVDGQPGRGFGWRIFPPGVTRLSEEAFRMERPGRGVFRAYLAGEGGEVLELSRPVPLTVVPPAPATRRLAEAGDDAGRPVRLVFPEATDELVAYAQREGFEVGELDGAPEAAPVVVVRHPDELADALGPEGLLRLWRWVAEGGAAVVLLDELPADHIGRIAGSPRGLRTLVHVPAPVTVGNPTGNFIGRVHVLMERADEVGGEDVPGLVSERPGNTLAERLPPGGAPRLMRSHEASLAPVAMLMGALPEGSRASAITVNHYRQRVGPLVCTVPFGAGQVVFVGLPLLEPVKHRHDPVRDRLLARLLEAAAAEVVRGAPGDPARPLDLSDEQLARLGPSLDHFARVVALADRFSFVVNGVASPGKVVGDDLAARDAALQALFAGEEGAAERLLAVLDGVWSEGTARFVEREERALARAKALILQGTPIERPVRARIVDRWGHAVMAWVAGDDEEAHALLDEAEGLIEQVEQG